MEARSPLHPQRRFEWERLVRRCLLGPNDIRHLHKPARPVAATMVKAVGLTLSTYANQDGSRIFPGDKKLAAVLGTSERSVRDARRVLEVVGLIERVKDGRGSDAGASEYRLTVPEDLIEAVPMLKPNESEPDEWSGTERDEPSGTAEQDRTTRPARPDISPARPDDTSSKTGRDVPPPIQDHPETRSTPPESESPAQATGLARAREELARSRSTT